jgi:hypothetical protein
MDNLSGLSEAQKPWWEQAKEYASAIFTQGLFWGEKATDLIPITEPPAEGGPSWLDNLKEYFIAIAAQGIWWGEKGKSFVEWIEDNKQTLYVLVGIIVVLVILIYMRPYAAIVSKGRR